MAIDQQCYLCKLAWMRASEKQINNAMGVPKPVLRSTVAVGPLLRQLTDKH